MKSKEINRSVFHLDGVPTLDKATPLAIQHLLAMIVGNITPAIIVAGVVGATTGQQTILIQAAMLAAGFSTLFQLYPMWKFGSGLPVITGVSFAFVPTLIALGSLYGLSGIFGAQIFGGIAAVFVGIFIKRLRKYFPHMVSGTVVLTIGLSLYPVAIGHMAGGHGAPDFGSPQNWLVAAVTLITVLVCNQFAKGYMKLASILVGVITGYIISLPLGMVSFGPVHEAAWFSLPRFVPFEMTFHPAAIITTILVFVVASVEMIGSLSAIANGGCDRSATDRELSGGTIVMGLSNIVSGFFGGLPVAAYSQNVGIVVMTKVISRFVIALAASFMIVAGFIPKFGALMTTIPSAVLGGATITVFASITMSGIKLIIEDELSTRNVTIVGLAVALGMGVVGVEGSLSQFPEWVEVVFGESSVVIASLVAFTLNIILPKKSLLEEAQEREQLDRQAAEESEVLVEQIG